MISQLARQVEEEEEKLSLTFLKKIREVNLEKNELEIQLNKARESLTSARSSRSSSICSSMNDTLMTSSIMSSSSIDEV